MMFLRVSGWPVVLLLCSQLCAESIPVENWALSERGGGYPKDAPLRNFVDVQQNTVFLKHPAFGIESFVSCSKARPGALRLSFQASALGGASSRGEIKVEMHGYHFADDDCTVKTEKLSLQKEFTVTGKKSLRLDFNIAPEDLKCVFCDELIPAYRLFITIRLQKKSAGISLSDIRLSGVSPFTVLGKKQVRTTWLTDELKKSNSKAPAEEARKKFPLRNR